jgi:hypothetical protein
MPGHQKNTLALCVMGLIVSGRAVLQRVAERISWQGINPVTMTSLEQRLAHFIVNDRVVVTTMWNECFSLVLSFWRGKPLRFVLACTPFRADATILYLGFRVHSWVYPLAWAVMPAKGQWEEQQWSMVARLLDHGIKHGGEANATLRADHGLSGVPLVTICRDRHWHDLLRVCHEQTCQRKIGKTWSSW